MSLYGEKGKTIDFSETIVVDDIKVSRCSQTNECMKLYEYQRSRSFFDPRPMSPKFNLFALETPRSNEAKFSRGASMGWGNESEHNWFISHDQDGHHVHISW